MLRIFSTLFMLAALPVYAAPPKVLTDIPAVHSLTSQVMGDSATPDILLSKGTDPHHFQMRPSQARTLSEADITFWIGPGLTPWLQRAIEGVEIKGKSVSLFDHAVEKADPHVWLDPHNAIQWLDVIAAELSALDPENAAQYSANAAAAKVKLSNMSDEIGLALTPAQDVPIIVFHDAYALFANRFGLNIAGAIKLGDASSPSAAHLAQLAAMTKAQKIGCAFGEHDHNPDLLENLLAASDIPIGELDPIGTSLEYGPALYETLLRHMAEDINACLNK